MLKRSHSSIPLFEIQLTPESAKNVVLIKGSPEEASPIRVTGNVTLNTTDSVNIKRIHVRLVGTMRLRWTETVNVPRMAPAVHPVRFDKTVFDEEFNGFESLLANRASPSNPSSARATPGGSMSNLAAYFQSHSSHTNLTSLTSTGSHPGSHNNSGASTPALSRASSALNLSSGHSSANSTATHLKGGTHSFPFEFVIPGDIAESIEGNNNAQVAYFLSATAERGRFQSNLTARRHVRIVRTLGVDTYDIAHTVSIENVWPGKVDYAIDVPSKAVAIGSTFDIRFHLVPLDKGLNIGKIRAQIVETLNLSAPGTPTASIERFVVEERWDSDDLSPDADEWDFARHLAVPRSLSKSTPNTTIQPHVKVTHKLKLFISLLNRDGHTSELRAALPIHLFISPHVPVSSQDVTPVGSYGIQAPDATRPEEPVFPANAGEDTYGRYGRDDDTAPPNYSAHVYDRLWSEVATPLESPSPMHSGTSTPAWTSPRGSLMDLDANQRAQLNAGLRALAQSRDTTINSGSNSNIDLEALSRVPSYGHALMDGADNDTAPSYNEND